MIKKIFIGLLVLLAILIAALCGVYMYAGEIIKAAVEKFVPEVTQTNVRLHNVDIALLRGHVGLSGLKIGNPKGYASENAFGVKTISVDFDPKSILTDKIVIQQILIDGIQVAAEATYENGQVKSNLTQIQKNVESYLAKGQKEATKPTPAATQTKPVASEESSKQVVIRDLQINNSELTVGVMKQVVSVALPNIQQKNIGESKKTTWQDAVAYIFNKVSTESVKATVTAIQDALRKGSLQIIGLAEENIEAAKEAAKEKAGAVINEKVGGALDSVKGLLGK